MRPADRLVAPLLSAALDNALRHGDRALTGPVARGDVETVRTHLPSWPPTTPSWPRPTGRWPPAPPGARPPPGCCPTATAAEMRALLQRQP